MPPHLPILYKLSSIKMGSSLTVSWNFLFSPIANFLGPKRGGVQGSRGVCPRSHSFGGGNFTPTIFWWGFARGTGGIFPIGVSLFPPFLLPLLAPFGFGGARGFPPFWPFPQGALGRFRGGISQGLRAPEFLWAERG